ncbi:hypothetical protein F2Q70_00020355 [Brassica cretica]|uniref:Uncharacterized protein n=1 Tax=Brassica cretica TaxID=69181 RepID=A0A8S9GJK0_BRACR|nr:hypothetical protein F2Q70_00020355 [Brassica cretica]
MTGVRQAAGGEARFSKLKRLMVPVGDLSQQRVSSSRLVLSVPVSSSSLQIGNGSLAVP